MRVRRAQDNTLVEGLYCVATGAGIVFAGADEDATRSAFLEWTVGSRSSIESETSEYLCTRNWLKALGECIRSWKSMAEGEKGHESKDEGTEGHHDG